jgi:hypothetical protein
LAVLAAVELFREQQSQPVAEPRHRRSPDVLYNGTFERYVHGQEKKRLVYWWSRPVLGSTS